MRKYRTALLALTCAFVFVAPVAANAGSSGGSKSDKLCARQFQRTVEQFDATFLARDLEKFTAFYHKDATLITSGGVIFKTKPEIVANFRGLFGFEFEATFTEVKRVVDHCDTAVIIVDFVLAIPALNYRTHFYVSDTFIWEHGRWQVILDQASPLPL